MQDDRKSREGPEEGLYNIRMCIDAEGGQVLTTNCTPKPSVAFCQPNSAHLLHRPSELAMPCVRTSKTSGSFHSTKYVSKIHAAAK